jgi:tryptophan-rich sensory protein
VAPWRIASAITAFALIALYAGGANYWNKDYGWYQSLSKPSWQPPDFVFGIIWPYNFIVLGFALYAISTKASPAIAAGTLAIFALSVFFALRWSYLFYSPHDFAGSASALAITASLTFPILIATFLTSWKIGIALLPYQIWIILAAALSASYASRN